MNPNATLTTFYATVERLTGVDCSRLTPTEAARKVLDCTKFYDNPRAFFLEVLDSLPCESNTAWTQAFLQLFSFSDFVWLMARMASEQNAAPEHA